MSTIKQKISKNRLAARKNRDKQETSILTVILGEIETREKSQGITLTNAEVVAILKKLIESCEMAGTLEGEWEANCLRAYIPTQKTRGELRDLISAYLSEYPDSHIGVIMGWLKREYPGEFNGGDASAICKELIK